jgi:ubiquitin-activating enzyme E1 C
MRSKLISPFRQITKPSLSFGTGAPLFFQAPPQLHEMTRPNLEKHLGDLMEDGSDVVVTAPGLPFSLTVSLTFE